MSRTAALVASRRALRGAAGTVAYRPRSAGGRHLAIRLWLPLTPLFLLLAPLALAGAAVGMVFNTPLPARRRGLRIAGVRVANPWRAAWALGGVLLSLSGTLIEVETPAALIRLRIF